MTRCLTVIHLSPEETDWLSSLELLDVPCRHLCCGYGVDLDIFPGQMAQPALQFKLIGVGGFGEVDTEGVPQQVRVERHESARVIFLEFSIQTLN